MVTDSKATTDEQARSWFSDHGWRLPADELRAALAERGATTDLVVELLDEAADRKRAAAADEARQRASANGHARAMPGTAPVPTPAPPAGTAPPQNLEAEESVIGAMMISPIAIDRVRDVLGDDGRDFYRDSHAMIYRAALALRDAGEPVDAITLTAELERRGELERVGGRVRLHELSLIVPASANAPHYAAIVRENATMRELIRFGGETAQAGWDREGGADEIVARIRERFDALDERATPADASHLVGAGDFILDTPDTEAIWGDDRGRVGWASGEGLVIVGPQGVGKTTLVQQLTLARVGMLSQLLGMPVTPDPEGRPALYIAADRPRQVARSFRRMVTEQFRGELNERIPIWRGPLPFLLSEQPTGLVRLCQRAGVGTVILDSIKDFVGKPSDEEHANRFNMAVQHCLAAGIEVIALHHQRKEQQGAGKPKTLADVYGNTFLTAGMGSVILLWGDPGDLIVEFKHLKQPADEVGPFNVIHDHSRGVTRVHQAVSLETILQQAVGGLTAREAASLLRQTDTPTNNDIAKARRQLLKLAEDGRAHENPGDHTTPARFYPSGAA